MNYFQATTDGYRYTLSLLLLPVCLILLLNSCGDVPVDAQSQTNMVDSSQTNFTPENFDATGSIQGRVIDKGEGTSLENVTVSLLFQSAGSGSPERSSATTNADGEFAFTDVPVNTDGKNISNQNTPYTLEIDASQLDNYRDRYLMDVALHFESTGGDGAATNLVADVTIPLNEQAVTVSGKLQSQSDDRVLPGVKVELFQAYNPIINGSSETETNMLLDSTETGADGYFEFTGVEEDADIWFRFIDESDPVNVIRANYYVNESTPAANGSTPEMDLGIVTVNFSNETGAFYIADITPENGADIHPDSIEFVYRFNRPVAQNEFTRTDLGFGSDTFKDYIEFTNDGSKGKAPGDLEFTVEWSAGYEVLTIVPDGLADAHEYRLDVEQALTHDRFVDEFGNALRFGNDLPYSNDTQALLRTFSTNANNAKPHTPVLEVDSTNITTDFYSGSLPISMEVDESEVKVKEYEIWGRIADNVYEYLTTIDRDDVPFNKLDSGLSPLGTAVGPLAVLRGSFTHKRPEESAVHRFKFRAVSENLREGDFSNEVVMEDVIKPDLIDSQCFSDGIEVFFSEPYERDAAVDPANYSFEDTNGDPMQIAIEEISLWSYFFDTDTPGDSEYSVMVVPEDLNAYNCANGESIVVSTEVADLAGNPMDDTDDDGDGNDNSIEY